MRSRPDGRVSRGLTVLEMLVVIAVLAVLMAVLIPVILRAREASRASSCQNNLRQIGLGVHKYLAAFDVFPAGYESDLSTGGKETGPGWGWLRTITPYIGAPTGGLPYDPLIDAPSVIDPGTVTYRTRTYQMFLCPASPGFGPARLRDDRELPPGTVVFDDLAPSNYVGSAGDLPFDDPSCANTGILYRASRTRPHDVDGGYSSTLLVGERSREVADATWVGVIPGRFVCTDPGWPNRSCEPSAALVLGRSRPKSAISPDGRAFNSSRAGPGDYGSAHPGGSQFLMADGAVRFFKSGLDTETFRFLSTRASDWVDDHGY